MDDPRVAEGRRWRVLWVHHEAEELRVHYRETIPEMTARHVIVDLLASGQVARMNAGGSDFDLDRLVALCPPCHAQTDAPYARGRLVITPLGAGRRGR